LLGLSSSAQNAKPVLIDEFGNIPCDDYLARVDNFYISLGSDPTAHGYAVISGFPYLRRRLAYDLWLDGAVWSRRFDPDRITKIRGKEIGDIRMQFWLVPGGAEPPKFDPSAWNFTFAEKSKPFVFHSEMEQICSSPTFTRPYKEYIDANLGSRGHVVIYAASQRSFRKTLQEAKERLKGIPGKRLRYFFVRIDGSPYGDNSYADYWLVPKRK